MRIIVFLMASQPRHHLLFRNYGKHTGLGESSHQCIPSPDCILSHRSKIYMPCDGS